MVRSKGACGPVLVAFDGALAAIFCPFACVEPRNDVKQVIFTVAFHDGQSIWTSELLRRIGIIFGITGMRGRRQIDRYEETTMTTVMTRLYETEAQATEIAGKIGALDYLDRRVDVITMPAPAEGGKPDAKAIAAKLSDVGVYTTASKKYSRKMVPGNAMVVVGAAFGATRGVEAVLNSIPAIDAGVLSEANMVDDGKNTSMNIIRVSGARSISKGKRKSKISSGKPKPFLGLKTIIKPKPLSKRPSSKPITPSLIISRRAS